MADLLTFQLMEHTRSEQSLPADFDVTGLQAYLRTAWDRRLLWDDETAQAPKGEPLLSVEYGGYLRAHNYVGLVQWNGLRVEIYPKVFADVVPESNRWFGHLLWWLSYCRGVRFPFAGVLADLADVNEFPEALIAHFARFSYRALSTLPYSRYQETTETLSYVRGRLNTTSYVRDSVGRGMSHQLICEHEPFVYDNRLNRIIKYVARQLSFVCRFSETYHALSRVLFLLDEVSDVPATATDCDGLHLNPMFGEYVDLLGMCRFFLSQSYLDLTDSSQTNYCFLVPMEYVFEDFLRGFIEEELSDEYTVEYQKSGWLTDEKVFRLFHDLFLTHKISKKSLIVDAKYKVREAGSQNGKKGIEQGDMYQLVSYALRSNCPAGLLLYPQQEDDNYAEVEKFTVSSALMHNNTITIRASSLPVISNSCIDFDSLKQILRAKLKSLLAS